MVGQHTHAAQVISRAAAQHLRPERSCFRCFDGIVSGAASERVLYSRVQDSLTVRGLPSAKRMRIDEQRTNARLHQGIQDEEPRNASTDDQRISGYLRCRHGRDASSVRADPH